MSGDDQQHSDAEQAQSIDDTQLEQDTVEISSQAGAEEASGEVSGEADAPVLDNAQLGLALQDAEAKADEYWNQLLLAKADLSNAQRRAERDVQNAHKFGVEKLVQALLPIKDSLDMGLTAAHEQGADITKVVEGIEITAQMFAQALEKMGVEELNPQGEKFDPEFHQAMTMQDEADVAPNTVLTVFQKGYKLSGRLMRPAMVVVSSAASGSAGGGEKKVDETA